MLPLTSILTRIKNPPSTSLTLGISATSAAAILTIFALRSRNSSPRPPAPTTIPSPRLLLGDLTDAEKSHLPYPPDILPGRWVDTPYGVMRVYEMGPARGRKVVFVHDSNSPSVVARDLLWEFVGRGCRVLTFDLYGTGYTDTPLSAHSHRLFTTQIVFALTSSPLHWSSFTLVGYSLGGGVAVSFASYFSHMVEELVLLAPTGLLDGGRTGGVGWRLARKGWIPEWLVAKWLDGGGGAGGRREVGHPYRWSDPKDRAVVIDAPGIDAWLHCVHAGLEYSRVSTFRHASPYGREEEWSIVGEYLGEAGKRVLVVVGREDEVVDAGLVPRMVELLSGGGWEGEAMDVDGGRVVGKVVEGGHDFVRMKGRVLAGVVEEFWRGSKEVGWVC